MPTNTPPMAMRKRIALIAHDNRKADLLDWARYNQGTLSEHELSGTGTTGNRATADFLLSSPLMRVEYQNGGFSPDEGVPLEMTPVR